MSQPQGSIRENGNRCLTASKFWREKGKAVLLCTHILPDVQAVSDAVVILANARVRVADRLEHLSLPTAPSLRVQILGDTDAFIAQLEQAGLKVRPSNNGAITVDGPHEELAEQIWQLARQSGVGVRTIEPSRNSLEEIFLTAVREQPDGDS